MTASVRSLPVLNPAINDGLNHEARLTSDLLGMVFTYLPAEKIPDLKLVGKRWNAWFQQIENMRLILLTTLPNREQEFSRPVSRLAEPELEKLNKKVREAFVDLMRIMTNMKSAHSLTNPTLNKGEAIGCSFVRVSAHNKISYRASIRSSECCNIINSEQEGLYHLHDVETAIHTNEGIFYSSSTQILKFSEKEKNIRPAYNKLRERKIVELKKDEQSFYALCENHKTIAVYNLKIRKEFEISHQNYVTAFDINEEFILTATDNQSLILRQKKDLTRFSTLSLDHETYITAMKAFNGKVYMGNNKGQLLILYPKVGWIEKMKPHNEYNHMYAIRSVAVEDCFLFALSATESTTHVTIHNRITRTLINFISFGQGFTSIFYGLGMLALGAKTAGLTSNDYNIPVRQVCHVLTTKKQARHYR